MSDQPIDKYLGQMCSKCTYGKYVNTNDNNKWWVKCSECETLLFCYDPMPHQELFHSDPHKFKMWAGGKKYSQSLPPVGKFRQTKKRAKFGGTLRALCL